MATPFLAEIKICSFNFPPKGWALCNGQLMSIKQNQALYAILGTRYGGDGQTTFALPNLQGRTALHAGDGYAPGQAGGEAKHTLVLDEMPKHYHQGYALAPNDSSNNTNIPAGAFLSNTAPAELYVSFMTDASFATPGTVSTAGNSQAHENRQPFLVLNFCIALQGIFPSPN